jgi:hypothetical protein
MFHGVVGRCGEGKVKSGRGKIGYRFSVISFQYEVRGTEYEEKFSGQQAVGSAKAQAIY